MKPLFFKAENAPVLLHRIAPQGELQWSRFFSKRKIWTGSGFQSLLTACFNGAAFFQSGKYVLLHGHTPGVLCFNGAAFFQSGKCQVKKDSTRVQGRASMEPLFFKAENSQPSGSRLRPGAASMEPLFFKAENNAASRNSCSRNNGFNGAAFFQSGKSACWQQAHQQTNGFNGAAFFQSGK